PTVFSTPVWWIGLKNPTELTKPYLLLVCRSGGLARKNQLRCRKPIIYSSLMADVTVLFSVN
ncbi:MAG TPA: hypothetical protein PK368_10500, partial [Bacteroidales bacterium]|nr:hypothetical protein [Bacteroidales bacterium]